jgi:hypothetical protein
MMMTDDFEAIKEYVFDHYVHFGAYPMDVETDAKVYTFDQYWAILDKENHDEDNTST